MNNIPGRPDSSEHAAYAGKYVDLVPGDDPLAVLAADLEETAKLFGSLDEARAAKAYAPGKWTLKQVFGHIIDTERIFAYRILRVARHDQTPLPGFEQDDFVKYAASDARSLPSLVEEFRAVRQATMSLLKTIAPEAWAYRGTVSGNSVTTRGLVYVCVGHTLHHMKIVRERYL